MGINSKAAAFMMANILMIFSFAGVQAQPLGIPSQQLKQDTAKVLCSETGRYVFGQISDSSTDQFMLDTLTGRLWRMTKSGEVGLYLIKVPYRHENGSYGPLPEEVLPPRQK
ncbi:MAG: hypothetical protein JW932_07220 [Deltaproteobacteria bacterium]|nr:hypothetical protein [Deltaproteobacteria bacterium]